MKFRVEIEVGEKHSSMEYYPNICSALISTIADVQRQHPEHLYEKPYTGDHGEIIDGDGFKIGTWAVVEDE